MLKNETCITNPSRHLFTFRMSFLVSKCEFQQTDLSELTKQLFINPSSLSKYRNHDIFGGELKWPVKLPHYSRDTTCHHEWRTKCSSDASRAPNVVQSGDTARESSSASLLSLRETPRDARVVGAGRQVEVGLRSLPRTDTKRPPPGPCSTYRRNAGRKKAG